MKNFKRISALFLAILVLFSNMVFAFEVSEAIGEFKFTKEFEEWLNLSEEERSNRIEPRAYDIPNTKYEVINPIARTQTVGNSLVSRFSLKDIISNNLIIKNQGRSQGCWSFAAIASLETNLALQNYYNQANNKQYDFSEKHLLYYCSRAFSNGETNKYGFNRSAADSGNYQMSHIYFETQAGPILESEMPFTDDFPTISLSSIQNKQVAAKIYDTKVFPSYSNTDSDIESVKNDIKNFVKQYGGVEAAIYGAELLSDFYNNETGALYCNDANKYQFNHDVLIIGWDDNYSIDNFSDKLRPQNDGAWIIKNSWGDRIEYTYDDMRESILANTSQDILETYGIRTKEDISDSVVENFFTEMGYKLDGAGHGYVPIGDNGFMYVSYEDANIYKMMVGIEKASDIIDNDYIYQYDFGPAYYSLPLRFSEVYISSEFDKQSSEKEFLTEVSLYAPETYECEVLVNPNGNSKNTSVLQKIRLKAGDTEVFDAGYHTIEFAEPLEITGNSFTVVVHIKGTRASGVNLAAVAPIENTFYDRGDIIPNKNFWTLADDFNNNREWADTSKLSEMTGGSFPNCNLTIKAFTVKENKVIGGPENPSIDDPVDDPTDDPVDDVHPITIIINNAKAKATNAKAYYYSDANTKEYMTMDVNLNNLTRSNKNDSSEYYYYLSTNSNEKNIENWIKIDKNQTSTSSLDFSINTNDLPNYSDMLKGKDIYIYIKEVVKRNNEEKTTVSNGIELVSNDQIEVYKDNIKQSTNEVKNETKGTEDNKNSGSATQAQDNGNTKSQADDTTSKNKLPNTGKTISIILIIVVTAGVGIFAYKKYKQIDF